MGLRKGKRDIKGSREEKEEEGKKCEREEIEGKRNIGGWREE